MIGTDWNTVKIQDMVGSRENKIHTTERIEITPCNDLGYCPYGYLVEFFPLEERDEYSCPIFGHDCPAYYLGEGFVEEDVLKEQKDCSKECCSIEE